MCSGVSGTICGGNGGGIDELILLLLRGAAGVGVVVVVLLLEELRFLGFGDSCGGTLLRLRFAVEVVSAAELIMAGSGARGR